MQERTPCLPPVPRNHPLPETESQKFGGKKKKGKSFKQAINQYLCNQKRNENRITTGRHSGLNDTGREKVGRSVFS